MAEFKIGNDSRLRQVFRRHVEVLQVNVVSQAKKTLGRRMSEAVLITCFTRASGRGQRGCLFRGGVAADLKLANLKTRISAIAKSVQVVSSLYIRESSRKSEETYCNRMGLFRFLTKNKKTLVNTLITTYGVANVKNHSIVHSEVTMDDLFNS